MHLPGGRIARVEVRKTSFFRRIFDEPDIQQNPDDENGGGDEENRPGGVDGGIGRNE